MKSFLDFLQNYSPLIEIFLIILMTVGLGFFIPSLFKSIYPKVKNSKRAWDDPVIFALHKPLRFFVYLMGFSFILEIARDYAINLAILDMITYVRNLGIFFLIIWFIVSFFKELEKNLLSLKKGKKALDQTTVQAIIHIMRISTIAFVGLIALQSFGVSVSGIIAFGGIGGIAVGFAAKDLLANFFGALMIFLDRPFSIGDWIRSPERNIEGVVEHIGWRLTRIRNLDRRPVYIPNAIFSSIAVENPGRMSNRKIKTNIGIRYCDASKMEAILGDVEVMLKSHEGLDHTKPTAARFVAFASSSLEFMIYAFTKATDFQNFHRVQQEIFLKVLGIIENHGAECAFPTTTIHFAEENPLKKYAEQSISNQHVIKNT